MAETPRRSSWSPPIQLAYAPALDNGAASVGSTHDQGAPRVLIVDDNPTNRRVLGLILDGAEMQTSFAENGQEAVDQWRANHFDAIFMDIQMPVMDGLTATRTIRALETRDGRDATPIIVVSANALPEHVEASHDAGADAHVAKPVTAASLFSALGQLDAA